MGEGGQALQVMGAEGEGDSSKPRRHLGIKNKNEVKRTNMRDSLTIPAIFVRLGVMPTTQCSVNDTHASPISRAD